MIDAAVVGLGRIGAGFQRDPLRLGAVTHAGAWARHPSTRLVAGVDPDPGQRELFEDHFGVPAYPTWAEAQQEHAPAMVSVCTPPHLHAASVLEALQGEVLRVVCEKPCTQDLPSARRLLEDLDDDAGRVGVNFTRRYDPLNRRLLGLVRGQGLVDGFGRYTAGLMNTASHWFDGLLAAGAKVTHVLALPAVAGADPTPTVVARLAGGGTVSLHGRAVDDYLVYETDLVTRAGRVRLTDSGTRGEWTSRVPSARYSGYHELRPRRAALPLGLSNPMLAVIDDAVRSVEEDRAMLCTVADAVAVHSVIDAVLRSLSTDGWVEVEQ